MCEFSTFAGTYAACGIQVRFQRKQMQFIVQVKIIFVVFKGLHKLYFLGLLTQLYVCHCELGQLSHQPSCSAWQVPVHSLGFLL